jgi:hypothetical protein
VNSTGTPRSRICFRSDRIFSAAAAQVRDLGRLLGRERRQLGLAGRRVGVLEREDPKAQLPLQGDLCVPIGEDLGPLRLQQLAVGESDAEEGIEDLAHKTRQLGIRGRPRVQRGQERDLGLKGGGAGGKKANAWRSFGPRARTKCG